MPKAKLTIESINHKLGLAKVGVKVVGKGDRLYLQATLPPKPGSGKTKNHQQQVSLGIYSNQDGLAESEALALEMGSQLARDRFDWSDWIKGKAKPKDSKTCGDWINEYRSFMIEAAIEGDDSQKDRIWRRRYYNPALKWLPFNAPLSEEAMLTAALHYKPNTRSRQLCCQIISAFAKWCGTSIDISAYRGKYSYKMVEREIPEDEAIIEAIDGIQNPKWRRAAAIMATYGLRDHEIWMCSFKWADDFILGKVLQAHIHGGKTSDRYGTRVALPLRPDWVERWQINNEDIGLPEINVRTNDEYGERMSRQFKRYKLPFTPYCLRHGYAIRCSVVYGIPVAVAADYMGHDPDLHMKIYNKHLSEKQKQEAYRNAVVQRLATHPDQSLKPIALS